MTMNQRAHHPNAFLPEIKNVGRGLKARTLILEVLEKEPSGAKTIIRNTQLHYRIIIYHLKLLKNANIVERKAGKKPYIWTLTGAGQKRLIN